MVHLLLVLSNTGTQYQGTRSSGSKYLDLRSAVGCMRSVLLSKNSTWKVARWVICSSLPIPCGCHSECSINFHVHKDRCCKGKWESTRYYLPGTSYLVTTVDMVVLPYQVRYQLPPRYGIHSPGNNSWYSYNVDCLRKHVRMYFFGNQPPF